MLIDAVCVGSFEGQSRGRGAGEDQGRPGGRELQLTPNARNQPAENDDVSPLVDFSTLNSTQDTINLGLEQHVRYCWTYWNIRAAE